MGRSKEEKLFRYIKSGSLHRIRSLLKKSKLDVNEIVDANGRSPLHVACILADDALVRILLKHGAVTEARDHHGNTPLHLAIKNGLELLNPNIYYDVVQPLLQASSNRIMESRNVDGETVEKLLKKLKRFMKKEKRERQQRLQREEQIFKEREAAREEEKEWREKLQHEIDCKDFYFNEKFDDSESTYEPYDIWADRILNERREKLRKMNDEKQNAKRQFRSAQTESELRDRTRQLESEHLAYLEKMREKCKKNESSTMKLGYEKRCRSIFQDTTGKGNLLYTDIPWPCEGDAEEAVKLLVEWSKMENSEESEKKYLKEQQVQWHPDRFMQRCGDKLSDYDRQQIIDRVKEISQHLNALTNKNH